MTAVQFEPAGFRLEFQGAALAAGIAVELGGRCAARQQHVGKAVAVAVEGGRPAAHHVFPFARIDAVNPGTGRFLDETRDSDGVFRRH